MFDLIIKNTDIKKLFLGMKKSYRLTRAGGNDNHLIVKTSIITFNLLPLRITCYLKEC